MRTLIALLFLGAFTTASAGCEDFPPPSKFDHAPSIPWTLTRIEDGKTLDIFCDAVMEKLGFAKVSQGYYGCTDIDTDEVFVLAGGLGCVSEEAIVRHEVGHLNGWFHR